MANTELKLHYYQKALVKKLTLAKKGKRFNELLINGLESEHMNYHLRKLVEIGIVNKNDDIYLLTDAGKDFSNLLDDGLKITEKQPKTSIIVNGVRKIKNGHVEHLLNRRLRQPYFGKVGHITGKVLFGETLEEAASRELYEETGLQAKLYQLEEIYRKMRKREDEEFVQDVIFYKFFVTGFSGKLIEKTPFQENFWAKKEEIFEINKKKYDVYDDFRLEDRMKPKKLSIREEVGIAEGF